MFGEWAADQIATGTALANEPPCRLLGKLGFKETGRGSAPFIKRRLESRSSLRAYPLPSCERNGWCSNEMVGAATDHEGQMSKGSSVGYHDRSPILIAIGVLTLLSGTGIGFLGPVEMYCFYLFSEGGRFHYPGFGFGSFMFGNIAAQIAGYYLIAALLIPFGYGHIGRRRWVRPLALTLIYCWLVLGIPVGILFVLVLLASKDVSAFGAVAAIVLVGAAYLVLPWLLLRFYRGRDLRLTLESRDPTPHWLERRPIPVLVLVLLYAVYGIVFHIPILFNGLFPLFGRFLTGLPGIEALALAILLLVLLAWGTFRQRAWAWWGSLVYWGTMTVSVIVTLVSTSYLELLSIARFPARELEFLDGIPLQGYHLALFFGLPLMATLGVIVASRRHFAETGPGDTATV
jgi:hypothetical protein